MKSFRKKRLSGSFGRSLAAAAAVVFAALAAPVQAADTLKIGFGMALTGGLAGAGKGALIAMQVWPRT